MPPGASSPSGFIFFGTGLAGSAGSMAAAAASWEWIIFVGGSRCVWSGPMDRSRGKLHSSDFILFFFFKTSS
jgi:hypothetical protein